MSDDLSPETLFCSLSRERLCFWLDSGPTRPGGQPDARARFSFLGCDPYRTVSIGPDEDGASGFERLAQVLTQELGHSEPCDAGDRLEFSPAGGAPPFLGGAVGYLAYDLGRALVGLRPDARPGLRVPLAVFGFYDLIAVFDHRTYDAFWVSTGRPAEGSAARQRAAERLAQAARWAERARTGRRRELPDRDMAGAPLPQKRFTSYRGLRPTWARSDYLRAVRRAKEYIAAGDIYQVNLAQQFWMPVPDSPAALFVRLRRANPAPFAAYFGGEGWAIASVSPERFLRMVPGRIETEPIKGTRPRGTDPAQDAAEATALQESGKDRAEHVMIVDLERNDLGRFCEFGSVTVDDFCRLEAHPSVWHLVSTVSGRPRPGITPAECVRHAFPGGSITGAPKIRAMQIIDELEPVARGVYTGSIGYIGAGARMDLNIAIRTVVWSEGAAYLHVGGGIVADSDPEQEYLETLHKGAAIASGLVGGARR
ncbi:MAG TPA: aminodeoxychorismate synthase component I [Limnochordia bacterium]